MKKIANFIDKITSATGYILNYICLIMILLGFTNAILRKLSQYFGVNLTSNMYFEMQWYLFALIFAYGFSYALLHKEHVKIDIFYNRFSKKTQKRIDFLAGIFFFIPVSLLLCYLTYPMVLKSWVIKESSPDPNGLPRYPLKIAVLLGLFLLVLQSISETIKSWYSLRGEDVS
ncbi:Tripartite ATP-independent periplasmic transporter DctQ component [Thermodesulfatator indicus DSM 15286]|uniref:Tripartite ATP-independent periplasmic transporter DctQ component n=1 Tax=Thermodesulfatator indicus (strain DSM 15286 / JCM 11887 / CIR29812) TaxID=667014 RepID=F8AD08_THEID|nr:TRAP transporter small permease subunit [Thermodesulfatator indicus]AEH45874.1 Tripartite ATP-independent periplasmic transporter DctQ component [Thermodesulfatator indicus DSM 15286]